MSDYSDKEEIAYERGRQTAEKDNLMGEITEPNPYTGINRKLFDAWLSGWADHRKKYLKGVTNDERRDG